MALLGNQEKVEYYRNDSPGDVVSGCLVGGWVIVGRGGRTEVLST